MSKVRILIPVGLKEIRAMMPPNHHIDSVKLVDDKGDGAVEVVYDDPSRKSPFTFPADQSLDEFKALGAERARLASIQKDKTEQELKAVQEAAEAQLRAEEAANEKESAGAPIDAAPSDQNPASETVPMPDGSTLKVVQGNPAQEARPTPRKKRS